MPDGYPMILCSVDFYSDSIQQLWIRDGDILKSSYSNKSFNGFFNQQSFLILPPQTFNDTIYSCWCMCVSALIFFKEEHFTTRWMCLNRHASSCL
ncbi:hypothetical protein QQF64_002233 [Cirrhinus molitorella]|uniref:Ig-like domain-containing protein n=1 Tax=Cirrhinus molitorella TaxID=172907 RepID=A0ABR3MPL2_9TELE